MSHVFAFTCHAVLIELASCALPLHAIFVLVAFQVGIGLRAFFSAGDTLTAIACTLTAIGLLWLLFKTRAKPALELSAFHPVSRDFAFIVDRGVASGDIVRAAQGVDKKLITSVGVFDVYEGKGVPEGKKSVAIAVRLQPKDKTLTDAEIEAAAGKIVAAAVKLGATLRS